MQKPREFAFLSSDYERAFQLRKEVLLDPFGIAHDAARGDDKAALHMGIFSDGDCLACLLLVPREQMQMQMRQVAVALRLQRSGLGRLLLHFAEDVARAKGFALMLAHARDSAVPFYQRLGYEIRGEPFMQVGIKHHLVRKVLGK